MHSAGLEDSKRRETATVAGRELVDYLGQIDYQQYFDAMGTPGARGGQAEARFADYSLRAVKAAQRKLAELLALMPRDDMSAAPQQVDITAF